MDRKGGYGKPIAEIALGNKTLPDTKNPDGKTIRIFWNFADQGDSR